MDESKELKIGDTATYEIAGKTVKMKPVTLGKMKRAMQAFQQPDGDSFDMMQDHLFEILSNDENAFVTKDWIRENITMPVATKIINDMRIVNGLANNSFFQGGSPSHPKETRDLSGQATPSV